MVMAGVHRWDFVRSAQPQWVLGSLGRCPDGLDGWFKVIQTDSGKV